MTAKLALLDMSQGFVSRGIPSLQRLGARLGYQVDLFDVRNDETLPRLDDYDLFVSSGGPGRPDLNGKGERQAVAFFDDVHKHNKAHSDRPKKLFLICHSFQLASMHFGLGTLNERDHKLFGLHAQKKHPRAPFDTGIQTTLESRFFQIKDDRAAVEDFEPLLLGVDGALTAFISRDRNIFATQFHPEAEPDSTADLFDAPDFLKDLQQYNPGADLDAMRARAPELVVPYAMLEKFLRH